MSMPRRPRMGRPPLAIPTELLGARIPRPICRRVRAAARKQGKKLGAFVAEILDLHLLAIEHGKKESHDDRD